MFLAIPTSVVCCTYLRQSTPKSRTRCDATFCRPRFDMKPV